MGYALIYKSSDGCPIHNNVQTQTGFPVHKPNIYRSGTNEETTMFSSILLGAFMACNQPATNAEYVPGALETDGKLIATVNGVQIKDGIVDSLLKDAPEAQRAL